MSRNMRSFFCKSQVLPFIFHARIRIPGKISNMHFPNHRVRRMLRHNMCILLPSCRIGLCKIHYHSPISIDSRSLRIGIHHFSFFTLPGDRKRIIGSLPVSSQRNTPDSACFANHRHLAQTRSARFLVAACRV